MVKHVTFNDKVNEITNNISKTELGHSLDDVFNRVENVANSVKKIEITAYILAAVLCICAIVALITYLRRQ